MLQIDDTTLPDAPEPAVLVGPSPSRWGHWDRQRRLAAIALVGYFLIRIESVLSSRAFETPDTASYTSGQATRPPLGSFLLSTLGTTGYELVSAIVSTGGFVAVAVALWNPARRRMSIGIAGFFFAVSMLPTFHVYEHWLIPDSLLVGLCLSALALAWPKHGPTWRPYALVGLLTLVTLTKEVGFSLSLLIVAVAAIRWSWRTALVGALLVGVLFVAVVGPASDRPGRVLTQEPLDTQLTMNRFRILAASLAWWGLDDRLYEVNQRAADCGMTTEQLMAETFHKTDRIVNFRNCPELWAATDSMSQVDVLLIHARHPQFVDEGIERGFAPYMYAMSVWTHYQWGSVTWLKIDRYLAGLLSAVPLAALAFAFARRRGRRLALVAMAGNALALAAILVDPSGQDRHAFPFRAVALVIAVMALVEIYGERSEPAADVADAGLEPTVTVPVD